MTSWDVEINLMITHTALLLVDRVVAILQIVRKIEDDGPYLASKKGRNVDLGLLDDRPCGEWKMIQEIAEFGDPEALIVDASLAFLERWKRKGLEIEF